MRIKEETEIIEGEVVELEIDRPLSGTAAKTVRCRRTIATRMYAAQVSAAQRCALPRGNLYVLTRRNAASQAALLPRCLAGAALRSQRTPKQATTKGGGYRASSQ